MTYLGGTDLLKESTAKTSSDFARLSKPKCNSNADISMVDPGSYVKTSEENKAEPKDELALKSELLDGVPLLKISSNPLNSKQPGPELVVQQGTLHQEESKRETQQQPQTELQPEINTNLGPDSEPEPKPETAAEEPSVFALPERVGEDDPADEVVDPVVDPFVE
eukprot:SAG31_NODE_18636_length_628_cov_2.228733_1_plen_164_part_10